MSALSKFKNHVKVGVDVDYVNHQYVGMDQIRKVEIVQTQKFAMGILRDDGEYVTSWMDFPKAKFLVENSGGSFTIWRDPEKWGDVGPFCTLKFLQKGPEIMSLKNRYRESVLDPFQWEHIGEFYQGMSHWMEQSYAEDHKNLEKILGEDWVNKVVTHENGGCAHCGAHYSYGSVFRDKLNENHFIGIGHTCAEERFTCDSNLMLRAKLAHKRGTSAKKNAKLKEKWLKFVADVSGLEEALKLEHYITQDIRRKGERYGSISSAQIDLLFRLVDQEKEKAERKKLEDSRIKVPVPESDERVRITGRVISVKEVDDYYSRSGGTITKMVVEVSHDEGSYRIWGTVPMKIWAAKPGDTVAFDAKIVRSDKDEAFGFFNRPTKPVILQKLILKRKV